MTGSESDYTPADRQAVRFEKRNACHIIIIFIQTSLHSSLSITNKKILTCKLFTYYHILANILLSRHMAKYALPHPPPEKILLLNR